MQCRHAIVNCVETYTPRLLFEHILNSISGVLPSEDNLFCGYGRCDNMYDFLTHLTDIIDRSEVWHVQNTCAAHSEAL